MANWMLESPFFHVTQVVDDLDVVTDVYTRLFARPIRVAREDLGRAAIFTRVGEQLLEAMVPGPSATALLRFVGRFGSHFHSLGWYVQGIDALAQELLDHGVRIATSDGTPITSTPIPRHGAEGANSSPGEWQSAVMWTSPNRAHGLPGMHELCEPTTKHELASWMGAEPFAADPLTVERGSHCTLLVGDGAAAEGIWCGLMGGALVGEGERPEIGSYSRWVAVGERGGTLLELAQPIADGPVADDWQRTGADIVHAYTFRVRDLDAVRRHLTTERFGAEVETDHLVITDPATTAGARYGFTDVDVGALI